MQQGVIDPIWIKGAHFTGIRGAFQVASTEFFSIYPHEEQAMMSSPKKVLIYKEKKMKKLSLLLATIFVLSLAGCTKVGSEAWCADMKEKPKGDWSTNQAGDFATHCVFK
jgi:hypothetical protein